MTRDTHIEKYVNETKYILNLQHILDISNFLFNIMEHYSPAIVSSNKKHLIKSYNDEGTNPKLYNFLGNLQRYF